MAEESPGMLFFEFRIYIRDDKTYQDEIIAPEYQPQAQTQHEDQEFVAFPP
jgi:hypothetical protein